MHISSLLGDLFGWKFRTLVRVRSCGYFSLGVSLNSVFSLKEARSGLFGQRITQRRYAVL